MIKKIDHLGVAVASHASADQVFEKILGLRRDHLEEVKDQRVKTAFYPCAGVNFELLESTDPEGPVGRFLAKKGEGFHHVAFEVDDIRKELDRLKGLKVDLIDAQPRKGAHDTWIAFLHPRATNGLLVELVERPKN
ncbi:MAG TPA: methylmalonyl-CoA epimerase [Candidatus Thermoplasmatota archaeon]|nr:methylmalonyl-CoA epimerase [Candidatus Thermoplasmatota archaeon]